MATLFINISGTIKGNDSALIVNSIVAYLKSITGENPSINVNSQDFSNSFSMRSLNYAKQQASKYRLK